MRKFDYVIRAEHKLAEHWINTDPRRFAILPTGDRKAFERAVADVEDLVDRFNKATSSDDKADFIGRLLDLHRRGAVLWPMGAFFNHSVLGAVDTRRVEKDLRSSGSDLLVILDALESDAEGPFVSYRPLQRRNFAFSAWKSLLSLRLATSKSLSTLATYDHDDFEALARAVRPGGNWEEWYTSANRKGLQYVARFVAVKLHDPNFAASIERSAVPGLPGPRRPDPFKACPHLGWLDELYEQFLDESKILIKKGPRAGKRLLGEFFMTLPKGNPSRVETAFNVNDMADLRVFAANWSTPTQRILAMGKINEFIDFIERQHRLGAIKTNGTLLLGLERHEVEHFNKSVQVPAGASRSADVSARPMPTRYHLRLKEIITADDFAWPKSLRNGVNGRPLHSIPWRDPETGRSTEVFCPVLPRLLLLMLDLPLRNVQVRRLDSGEGDAERWNSTTHSWEANTGRHGGFWKRMGVRNPRRGCIRRIATSEGGSITGIYVNSNKTQDRGVLFDDTAGYEIPWEHVEVLENLDALRDWQERYNPVAGPLPHSELAPHIFNDEPSKSVRALIPDRFFLFRYPQNPGERGAEMPVSYPTCLQFFYDALEELERRLNLEDPERPVTIITGRDHSGAPKKAVFTLHGMRSSTLTSLHMAGVPIEMLSKVVAGHASILMTLKYVKFDPMHVSQVLTEARLKAATKAKAEFPDLLGSATYAHAIRMTARLTDDGVKQMKGAYKEPSTWLRLDIGLCPNGGTLCNIGGDAIQRRNDKGVDKSTYAPVPGGERNCIRCRFFVTGLPFLIPLWAHGSAIMAQADACARQADERSEEVRRLKQHRKTVRELGETVTDDLREKITATEEAHIHDCERRNQALADFHSTLALIEKIRAIAQHAGDLEEGQNLPMLLPDDEIPEIVGRESTRFEVIDAVVQQSRCFPSLVSADIERERDEFLNQILYRNGYVPITMSPLPLSERRRAADAMAAFLLLELGAAETDHLAAGRKSLSDLGLQDKLEAACRTAVGKPLNRIEARPLPETIPAPDRILAAE
ncbi:VPA1269 family protein [Methylobacterium sp. AMS5]|uniref:VPA1269 family protein n=1 Tax=Methylobacterium sp. AMS5 TaxID=925818 RepID=UPI00074F9372|nr:VPA1269 family protein [Methylobacterium sp. AMS5]AMB44058.1 hypothetical protein Y590_04055 [Methylobacterium sp. AMS5]